MRPARRWAWWVALAAPLLAARAQAQEPGWEVIARGDIVVKVRTLRADVREVWAEGELDAEVQDLEAAILDADAYPHFMPYVKETYTLETLPDGSRLVYTRLEPPFVAPRDYVVKVRVHRRSGPDGRGEFANAWQSVPDRVPRRPSVVRLPVCDGSWTVTRAPSGRARVVYRAAVDPGGWVPGFISDLGNRSGAIGTIRAVEREARRRGESRKAQAANELRRRPSGTR